MPSVPQRSPRRPALPNALAGAATWALVLAVPSAAGPAAPPVPQGEGVVRPDQVLVEGRRSGSVSSVSGTVVEASLRRVVVETSDGEEREFDADEVQRVVLGGVPTAFRDAETYFDRDDYESAAAQFRLAVEESERSVVQAEARMRAAESLLMMGTRDPGRFQEAAAEAARFRADFPQSFHLPGARVLEARAQWLGGEPAAAAELFQAVYEEAGGGEPTPGYPLGLCYRAGDSAAEAFLAAGDTAHARELFASLSSSLPNVLAGLDEGDPTRVELVALEAEARLGEGWALLVGQQASRARTFFESQLSEAGDDAPAALRFDARLGLAEALLAEGSLREGQLEFAQVAALDYTDRERTARALLGLARTAVELGGDDTVPARTWLEAVRDEYGDTPSGPPAAALLAKL